ncbi:hypothetical protein DACRYDRAFT_116732 [Dacryopinax primogenitus]|uniref:Uncharacterized protein n=1 Tax=Dacryopinax primogenitus (strain DJM 731) TaxID=1858805 RepID=M5G756_DACPD|nr:uncharacterized protein DACRYDRAFT_116732 [Dacryopinax primogenitus]EJU01647.1 hypothetical protein DACRYDRAFT_116732 [Dacryopinax primogenitus]
MYLARTLQTRLQYARLKVEHGWTKQTLNEVENLYFHHTRSKLPTTTSLQAAAAVKQEKEQSKLSLPLQSPMDTQPSATEPLDLTALHLPAEIWHSLQGAISSGAFGPLSQARTPTLPTRAFPGGSILSPPSGQPSEPSTPVRTSHHSHSRPPGSSSPTKHSHGSSSASSYPSVLSTSPAHSRSALAGAGVGAQVLTYDTFWSSLSAGSNSLAGLGAGAGGSVAGRTGAGKELQGLGIAALSPGAGGGT